MNETTIVTPPRIKTRIVAGTLALFLGFLGAHRLYLGDRWWIAYPLLCWTGLPILLGFVEAIVFMVSDQTVWDQRHNPGLDTPEEGMASAYIAVGLVALMAIILLGGMIGVGYILVFPPSV